MLEWPKEDGAGRVGSTRGGRGGGGWWAFAVTKCEALHALIPVHKSHRQIKPSTWFTAGINTTRSACVRETWYERWVDRRLHPLPLIRPPPGVAAAAAGSVSRPQTTRQSPPAARAILKQPQFLYLRNLITELLHYCVQKFVYAIWIKFDVYAFPNALAYLSSMWPDTITKISLYCFTKRSLRKLLWLDIIWYQDKDTCKQYFWKIDSQILSYFDKINNFVFGWKYVDYLNQLSTIICDISIKDKDFWRIKYNFS